MRRHEGTGVVLRERQDTLPVHLINGNLRGDRSLIGTPAPTKSANGVLEAILSRVEIHACLAIRPWQRPGLRQGD